MKHEWDVDVEFFLFLFEALKHGKVVGERM